MLDLIIVRHGESIRNHAALLAHQGKPESLARQLEHESYEPGWPLTRHGRDQATAAGKWIKTEVCPDLQFGFVSPYFRTLQTARGLGLSVNFEQDWRLRERHWGEYLNLTEPYTVDKYLDDLSHAGEPNWKPNLPGAESVLDLLPNVKTFVQDRLVGLRDSKVVVVTHGGAMKAMEHLITGQIGTAGKTTPNCCIVHYHLHEVHPDGSATGEVVQQCPYMPETPHMAWHHFG
jgi:broad specificity phosphatase PhoE